MISFDLANKSYRKISNRQELPFQIVFIFSRRLADKASTGIFNQPWGIRKSIVPSARRYATIRTEGGDGKRISNNRWMVSLLIDAACAFLAGAEK